MDRFYSAAFWGAAMGRVETTVETAAVLFDPATAKNKAQVHATEVPVFKTAVTTEHGAADAAEIAGSEVAAHNVSNPMYTALLTGILAAVRPPSPATLTAVPTRTTVVLNWNQDPRSTTGATIERAVGTGVFAPLAPVGAGGVTFTDTGLTPNTAVRYRVRALNAAGLSAPASVNTHTAP